MGRALSTARPTAPGGDVHLLTHLLAGGGGGRHPWPEAARIGAPLTARPTARLAGSGAPTPQLPHGIIAGTRRTGGATRRRGGRPESAPRDGGRRACLRGFRRPGAGARAWSGPPVVRCADVTGR